MNRRQMLLTTGMAGGGFVIGSGFTAPACDGVSKDKAVRYAGLAINYLKDILPIVGELGGSDISALIGKAIPLLEKVKLALEKTDIPTAQNFFDSATSVLGQVANALLQLPESTRRTTIMGILTLANVTLRTVSLFVESEAPAAIPGKGIMATHKALKTGSDDAIRRAFDATRF